MQQLLKEDYEKKQQKTEFQIQDLQNQQENKIRMLINEIERLNQVLMQKQEENKQQHENIKYLEEEQEKSEEKKRKEELKYQCLQMELQRQVAIVDEYQKQSKQQEQRIEQLMEDNYRLREFENKTSNLQQANHDYQNKLSQLADEVERLNSYLLIRGQELENLRQNNFNLESQLNIQNKSEDHMKNLELELQRRDQEYQDILMQKINENNKMKEQIINLSNELERLQLIINQYEILNQGNEVTIKNMQMELDRIRNQNHQNQILSSQNFQFNQQQSNYQMPVQQFTQQQQQQQYQQQQKYSQYQQKYQFPHSIQINNSQGRNNKVYE